MVKKILISLLSIALIGCSQPILNNTTQNNDYSQYADLDQEYSQFTTKALTESYLKKKMDKWTSSPTYSKKLLREVEYAKYKHPDILKDVVAEQPPIFTDIVSDSSVVQKRQESSFDNYIKYIDPHPHDVTAIDATNVTDEKFTANWTPVDNAKTYKLFIDDSQTPIIVQNTTSFDVTGLTPSTTHTYHLKATNLAGETPKSNDVNVKLYDGSLQIAQPPVDVTSTGFTAKWDSVDNPTSYKVYVDGILVYTGLDTSFIVSNLTPGVHTYKIIVVINGKEYLSDEKTVTIQGEFLAPVATAPTDITNRTFKANWNAVTGATSYKLYVDDILTYTGSNNYFTVNNLQRNSTHKYTVVANNGTLDTSPSNEISVTTSNVSEFFAPVATDATTVTKTSFKANWNAVDTATSYKLYVDNVLTYTGSNRYFTVNNLQRNSTHKYKVIANNGTVDTLASNEITVTTLDTSVLQAPVATDATTVKRTSFIANWNSVVGASEYQLYVDGNLVYTGDDTSSAVTGLTINTQYSYYVKCVVDSNLSESSNAISVQTKFGEFKIGDDTNGNVIVNKNNGDFVVITLGDNFSFDAQIFNSDGVQKTSKFQITSTETSDCPDFINRSDTIDVAIDNNNNLIVSYMKWIDKIYENRYIDDKFYIYVKKFDSNGNPLGSEFQVNTSDNFLVMPKVVVADDGSFRVFWKDVSLIQGYFKNFAVNGVYMQKYDANSNPIGPNVKIDYSLYDYPYHIKMNADGSYILAWVGGIEGQNTSLRYIQKFDSNGNPISPKYEHQFCYGCGDYLIIGNDGSFIYTWRFYDNGSEKMSAQKYNSSGNPSGSEFTPTSQEDITILNDGKFVQLLKVYDENSGGINIYAQIYNSDGTPYGSEFKVNLNSSAGFGNTPILSQPDGSFVIIWTSSNDGSLYAKIYDINGNPL